MPGIDVLMLFGFIGAMCIVGYLIYRSDMKKSSEDYWRK